MKRSATSQWDGSLNDGVGIITTTSSALSQSKHSYKTRYKEDEVNETSPEELIAAAHADCYSSMFKIIFEKENYATQDLKTSVEVTVDDETLEVNNSHIFVTARIPNITKERFIQLATLAKDTCPVSKLLKTNITLDCQLID